MLWLEGVFPESKMFERQVQVPVKVVALLEIRKGELDALAAYLEGSLPILESAGAKIVQRFELTEPILGKSTSRAIVIVEYPNREAIDEVFASKAYRALIPIRDRAFSSYDVSVVEQQDAS